jgi:hypothetical protein
MGMHGYARKCTGMHEDARDAWDAWDAWECMEMYEDAWKE